MNNENTQKIRNFMCSNFMFEFDQEITTSSNLFKTGVIDSFGYIQLISFIQDTFSVSYSDEEMLTNILESLDKIVASIDKKTG